MRKFGIFGTIMICTMLSSCMSAMKIDKSVREYQSKVSGTETQIEFIGFKADSAVLSTSSSSKSKMGIWGRETVILASELDQWKAIKDTDALRKIGTTLQRQNIAVDQSFAYFGIYSLQELELYKSQKRYVTFIEVTQNRYNYDISGELRKNIFGGIGAGLVGGGIGTIAIAQIYNDPYLQDLHKSTQTIGIVFSALGVASLIPALIPEKTTTTFSGSYNIYLYDTQRKEVVYKEAVTVYSSDTWKGSLSHNNTNLDDLYKYYGTKISNAILEKYDEVYHWLATK